MSYCCSDFEAATKKGTDNEGYWALVEFYGGEWIIGTDLLPILRCPWCAAVLMPPGQPETQEVKLTN